MKLLQVLQRTRTRLEKIKGGTKNENQNLRIKQLLKVAKLMNRYPALSEAQQEVYQYATNIVYLL